jgi:adenylate cyclase class 2
MAQEIEVMFANIDKEELRNKLKELGAVLVRPEYNQHRTIFDLIHKGQYKWIRVRDEGVKVTLSYKEAGFTLEAQKEIEIVVDDYRKTIEFLQVTGHVVRSVQETKRELWVLDGAEVTIDTWPFIEPVVEIEGETEAIIKNATEKLGFDYTKGIFSTVNVIYKEVYGKYIDELPQEKQILTFDGLNPFL